MLATVAQERGLRARRFTYEEGDLSTPTGRRALLHIIKTQRPKLIRLALECGPWSAWNRFNSMRSLACHEQVMKQQRAKEHLVLCNVIAEIQHDDGRHAHLESPKNLRRLEAAGDPAVFEAFHSCSVGPMCIWLETSERTSADEKIHSHPNYVGRMVSALDFRLCNREHNHRPIAGRCQWKGHRISVSRFAAIHASKP